MALAEGEGGREGGGWGGLEGEGSLPSGGQLGWEEEGREEGKGGRNEEMVLCTPLC